MAEQGKGKQLQCVETTDKPIQVFSLINPSDNSHSLPNVAEVRLCKIDLKFGVEIVTGILDQVLSAHCCHLVAMSAYELMCLLSG